MRQFETFCKRCGRKILMTRNEKEGRWVPCEPEIRKYEPEGGPFTYVTPEGKVCRGKRMPVGYLGGEWGYQKHRIDCAEHRRYAV